MKHLIFVALLFSASSFASLLHPSAFFSLKPVSCSAPKMVGFYKLYPQLKGCHWGCHFKTDSQGHWSCECGFDCLKMTKDQAITLKSFVESQNK